MVDRASAHPPSWQRWLVRAVAALVLWACALAFAALTDRGVYPVALAAGVLALLAVVWLAQDTIGLAETPPWSLYSSAAARRTFDPRFSRLSQDLAEAADRRSASLALHASLDLIADQILLEEYDVDRERDPERAREILGEQVTAYLASAPGSERQLFSPELDRVLDRLEML